MADKCTQTDWSWLQHQIPAADEQICRESDSHTEERDIAIEISIDSQERVKTPHSELSRGKRESRRTSAVRYSDESRLFQTSPEFDEFVAMLTDLKSDDEDDDEEDADHENDIGEETEPLTTPPPPPYPSLSSFNLPWPAILQYLRESESLSSEYFSLARRQQDSTPTAQQCRPQCFFCEQTAPAMSLLPVEDSNREEPAFCCTEFRDYCVLVVAHTQKMRIKGAEQRPGKINIATEKIKIKKTAEEKALEILRRKRKWEENTRKLKLLESSSVYAMTRQNRTLQFSLAEPTCMNRGWAPVGYEETQTEAAKKQRKHQAMKVPLPLSNIVSGVVSPAEVLSQLEQHHYKNGVTSAILLPDRTGQCYYPSGHNSVHITQLYPGVLMYLIYEDSDNGVMEGYLDELGRAWCGNGSSLKMVCGIDECYQFDSKGKLKTHWQWSDTSSYSVHLPLVVRVNSHITVRYNNQDDVTLTFSTAQQMYRFKISRRSTQIYHSKNKDKYITELKKNLHYLQANFDFHLSRLQLAAQLAQSRDKSLLPPLQPRRVKTRTRSTGTVTFKQ